MNDLCVDVGFNSLIKKNEVLCGDNVSTITCEDGTFIAVLADGLGSGVKACILSTLTSKIISTMVSENIDISECVKTIAATLPICQVRGLAYSTFTILKILPTQEAEIFQYDNPDVIFMRDGKNVELPYVSMNIDGKEITHTKVKLLENDTFILMSDGVIHAGVQAGGMSYAFGWESFPMWVSLQKRCAPYCLMNATQSIRDLPATTQPSALSNFASATKSTF